MDSNTNDNRGNITSIKRYNYTTGIPSGTPLSETKLFYKTSGWKDQITRIENYVNGVLQKSSIYAYDSIGNLLSITSDTNQSFDWEGRRLIEHIIGGITYTYNYNNQGIRISKSNGTNTTEYFVDGSLVLFEKTGNDVIYYTYDVDGSILSMNYLGDEYFYIKNVQGDIIEIVNGTGNTVAKYRYDAWGNIVYQWDSVVGIANINPYRYRSYRLDVETGLYYLNARYYNPSIGRFISADSINYLDPSSEQGLNLYAYCVNNPVMMVDPNGNFAVITPKIMKFTSKIYRTIITAYIKIEAFINNEDEKTVLDSKYFSFYKGSLVIRHSLPVSSCALFGLVILNKNETRTSTVKHEWGHTQQYKMMGTVNYIFYIAIPSVRGYLSDEPRYYAQPWEHSADILGEVGRNYRYILSDDEAMDYVYRHSRTNIIPLPIPIPILWP
ncbi:MAG: RHS repeat-associated core domain-containing protein [Tenericutes bacterium]|nr:RHS repeat-associated core domain-containing protein [Mycoplasmatota bacterium]